MSRAGRRLVLAFVVVVGALLGTAAPAGAESSITVRAAAGEHYTPGKDVAVIVTVASDSLLTATVRASGGGNGMMGGPPLPSEHVEVPIEVAGGTEKQVVLVVPTSRFGSGNFDQDERTTEVEVELVVGGDVAAGDSVEVGARDWEEAVGLLPELAGLDHPETAALRYRTGDAALVPVDPLVLAAGPGALDVFPTIAALPADLSALSPEGRATLHDWLAAGGHLLVDGEPGDRLDGLPDEWQPGAGGWATAGAGDVRLTGDRLAKGAWDDLLEPTAGGLLPSTDVVGEPMVPGYSIAGGLGVDAGFRIPQLGALLIALSLYVLLVGPILFVVLGRLDRRQLAWVAIPAIACVFTALFAVTGAQLRNDTEAAHATVIEIGPTGAQARTSTLIGSISGGTTVLEHPSGWTVDDGGSGGAQQLNGMGMPMAPNGGTEALTPALVPRGDGVEAAMTLDPGEFVLVQSRGPAPMYAEALTVSAAADGTTITGTVRNHLDAELTQVNVLVGFAATPIGTIGPGEERTFTVEDPRSTADAPYPEYDHWTVPPEDAGDPDLAGMGMVMPARMACGPNGCMNVAGFGSANPEVDPESKVNPSAWSRYLGERNDALRALDTVSVVGWSDEVDSPLRTGGGEPIRRGRTALVAKAPIAVQRLDTVGVRAEIVREVDFRKVDRNYDDAIVNGSLYRIVLPTTVGGEPIDPTQVSIRFPAHLRSVLLWRADGSYVVVPEPAANERIVYTLTAEDVETGVVYVRTRLQDQLNMPADLQPPGLQGRMATVRAGWEIFTGSVDDVTDSDRRGAGGGFGTTVPGTAPPPPVELSVDGPVMTTMTTAPPIEAP